MLLSRSSFFDDDNGPSPQVERNSVRSATPISSTNRMPFLSENDSSWRNRSLYFRMVSAFRFRPDVDSASARNACFHPVTVTLVFFFGCLPSTSHSLTISCALFQSRVFNASRRNLFRPSVPVTQMGHLQRYSLRDVYLHRFGLWRR